jgi:prevent-host-death family protein
LTLKSAKTLAGALSNSLRKARRWPRELFLSRFLREAEKREIVITRHGKPAGVLIGFKSEDDWFDDRLESDPRFLSRVEKARSSLREGRGLRLEEIPSD